jgi:hypothetical protein
MRPDQCCGHTEHTNKPLPKVTEDNKTIIRNIGELKKRISIFNNYTELTNPITVSLDINDVCKINISTL